MIKPLSITAYDLAETFIGLHEVEGPSANPLILWMLQSCYPGITDDVIPWCSSFPNAIHRMLRLPRTNSLRARSWLAEGRVINIDEAERGFDLVILTRGPYLQPGPSVIEAPGHVGYFHSYDENLKLIYLLGGNQNDAVNVTKFDYAEMWPKGRILGIRRLHE